jgi:hypothetical protein
MKNNLLHTVFEVMIGVAVVAVVMMLVLGLSWFAVVSNRPLAKYQKETERQVYQNSIARQQGANNGIAQDCANMQSNAGPERLAFARFVLTDAAAYSGSRGLSDDALACVQQARAALAASN